MASEGKPHRNSRHTKSGHRGEDGMILSHGVTMMILAQRRVETECQRQKLQDKCDYLWRRHQLDKMPLEQYKTIVAPLMERAGIRFPFPAWVHWEDEK